jgi:hypothetical protein
MGRDFPKMDRDLRLLRMVVYLYPLLRRIFRIQVMGVHTIPAEPCILVANHNIGAVVEVLALVAAWEARFPPVGSHRSMHSGIGLLFAFRYFRRLSGNWDRSQRNIRMRFGRFLREPPSPFFRVARGKRLDLSPNAHGATSVGEWVGLGSRASPDAPLSRSRSSEVMA